MFSRNASISARSTSASRRSAPEALSTSLAAVPASVEAEETPTMLLETSLVPPAACWMLRAISRVAAPCSSTAAAIAVVTSLISLIVLQMFLMAPTADRRHRLHADDLLADFVGGFRGLVGEALHLGSDHGEAAAGFAGARGLDGGVERQQIGLRGDGLDQVDHHADAPGVVGKPLHGGVGGAGFLDRLAGDFRRGDDLAADFGDRGRQFLGARRHGLHVDRGFLGGGGHRAHQRAGLIGGRRHALRGGLHRAGRRLQAVQRGANGGFEFDDPGFHARGALGLGDAVLVLVGSERAGLDHALAEHLQRVRHRRDLVVLAGLIDFGFEIAVGQHLHRALQVADPPQDVAADIEPDEQDRSDQGRDAERQHDVVASEISWRAWQVEASVSFRTPSTSCCTLMPRPTLSLRVSSRMVWP